MRKLWILAGAVLLSCVFGSGYFYFFSMYVKETKTPLETVSSPVFEGDLYYNQLGVYANTTKMDQEVISLESKGIQVYTFRKNELTVYVTHVSTSKEDTIKGQGELTALGYTYVLKSETITDQEVITLLKDDSYQKALETIYEDQGIR